MKDEYLTEAIGRARAWALLGELILKGVRPELEPVVLAIPIFKDLLGGEIVSDALAAEHQRVLGFEVFPFESVFLSEDAQLGGPVSEAVADAYERAGFPRDWQDVEADHLGVELLFMANLCAREIRETQLEDGDLKVLQQQQRLFLDSHLLRWLPPLVAALRHLDAPFICALVEMSLELAVDHREYLGEAAVGVDSEVLSSLEDLLAEKKTRLKDVARFLLNPTQSGVFLSRKAIGHISIAADGPPGFGGRLQLLESAMFGAVDRGTWRALVDALICHVNEHESVCLELRDQGADVSSWLERMASTRVGLGILRIEAMPLTQGEEARDLLDKAMAKS